ncbi:MAG TPA: F0F1 ATP synthase subunit delta [Patescibacteria group bacterium]|nr:F0F1 ATP synthase subunit delta [Patescibacteria group bacterium]
MKVPRHILAEAIAEKTMALRETQQLAHEIAAYLLVEGRVNELESILRDIMQYRADHGVLEAEVVTAHDIQPHVLDEVKSILKTSHPHAKSIELDTRLEPTVVGGLRVDMANEQLDMTVARKLATFKRLTTGDDL